MSQFKRPIQRIACVGEVMIEMIASAGNQATLGVAGDTYNTAVYLARALKDDSESVCYVTALGTDPYSERILAALRSHGIETTHVERRDDQMPGLYAIETDDSGERSFFYWRSASAARSLFSSPCDITPDKLDHFDLVFLSGISMAILPKKVRGALFDWADGFRAAGGTLVYDSNHRPKLWESVEIAQQVNTEMWRRADIALPSVDDEMALFDDTSSMQVIERLASLGAKRGALKRGADGPVDLATGETPQGLAQVETVIDSTAAGDSFNAGYLSAIVQGSTDLTAASQGHALAAKVIQHPGAIIPLV